MSEVLVHGIVAAPARTELDEPGTRWIVHDELAALVSDADASAVRVATAVRLHWRVLERLAESATVLPVRFGTVLRDDEAVVDELLLGRREELRDGLAALTGKVQMTVKAEFDQERLMRGILDDSPTVSALRARIQSVPEAASYYDRIKQGQLIAEEVKRRREQDAATIVARLEPLALDSSMERLGSAEAVVNAAFLVDERRREEFEAEAERLERELAGRVYVRVIGPLPPYSFTDINGERRIRMGLITGLLTLPLAPVRGTVWIAEQLLEQAEREYYGEEAIRARLVELDLAREQGLLTEEEATRQEDELLGRLLAGRERGY